MNSAHRVALTAAAVAVTLASMGCGPAAVAPSPTVAPATAVSGHLPSSPEPSPSPQADRMTLQVRLEAGPLQQITVKLPKGWANNNMAAARGSAGPPEGMGFRVSLVDNTFEDPCAHVERTPKIGSTVDALTTALGEIPSNARPNLSRRRSPGTRQRTSSLRSQRRCPAQSSTCGRTLRAGIGGSMARISWSRSGFSRRAVSASLFRLVISHHPRSSEGRASGNPRLDRVRRHVLVAVCAGAPDRSRPRHTNGHRVSGPTPRLVTSSATASLQNDRSCPFDEATYRPTSYQLFERCAKVLSTISRVLA